MLVQLQRTVNEWNNRNHLLPFLKKGPLVVCIKTEDEVFYIHINNETVELLLEEKHHPINAELQGNKEILLSLLRGEMKLRQAKASNLITLKSSFRTELYLETMCYLVKPYEHVSDL
jgi:putative sterol carrier protein